MYELYISALDHVRELKLRGIVHLNLIYKLIALILLCLSDSAQGRRGSYFQAQALYLSLRTSYGVNTREIFSSRSHKHNL